MGKYIFNFIFDICKCKEVVKTIINQEQAGEKVGKKYCDISAHSTNLSYSQKAN